MAFIDLGGFEDAVTMAKKALSQSQTFAMSYCSLVSALVHLGREAEARDAATGLLNSNPTFASLNGRQAAVGGERECFSMASEGRASRVTLMSALKPPPIGRVDRHPSSAIGTFDAVSFQADMALTLSLSF